jgi:cation diffusion facilitator CzcD-associated flavoprotein CzcO
VAHSADELRAKYRAERDKRIRPDGADQYIRPDGDWSTLFDDPYVTPVDRPAQIRDVDVVVVGAGFSGLIMGAKLREAGVDDFVIVDRAGDVGGVWYWNRYPGAMCDTAAMVYLPLLEETGARPSMKYVPGYEIHEHAQRIATTFDLYERFLGSTQIEALRWDEDRERWIVTTDRGDELSSRFVTVGTGPIARPKLPGIPGIELFRGTAFHTSRWNYDYTGGDRYNTPMTNLADKRVGIIGTGATGVQVVPHVARSAGELFVFQRTPSSIDVRNNHTIDPEWYDTLEPGWQKKWLMNFTTLQTGGFTDEDLVKDGWTDISQRIRDRVVALVSERGEYNERIQQEAYEASDDEKMEEIRARVDRVVNDPVTAEALKPWYRQLCKRPCFHDEYLDAFNADNVHLIDTDGQGVERIDEAGVWVNGTHYDLDCLIYASGFEVGNEQTGDDALPITGCGGVTLHDAWAEGMATYLGLVTRSFPNLFHMSIAQGANLVSNIPHNYWAAAEAIAAVIGFAKERDFTRVESSRASQDEWVANIAGNSRSLFGNPDCTPGYYNNEGRGFGVRERLNSTGYPLGAVAYFQLLEEWWQSREFSGLEFSSSR